MRERSLLCSAIAYFILTRVLIASHGKDSALAIALAEDFKDKVSLLIYAVAIGLAIVNSWFACILYTLVAIVWLIPDRPIEKTLTR